VENAWHWWSPAPQNRFAFFAFVTRFPFCPQIIPFQKVAFSKSRPKVQRSPKSRVFPHKSRVFPWNRFVDRAHKILSPSRFRFLDFSASDPLKALSLELSRQKKCNNVTVQGPCNPIKKFQPAVIPIKIAPKYAE
jgi:hypothetical protein